MALICRRGGAWRWRTIEATAYGTRVIVEAFENNGVPVNELVACGGLPEKNKLLMQIYADVTGREKGAPGFSRGFRGAAGLRGTSRRCAAAPRPARRGR